MALIRRSGLLPHRAAPASGKLLFIIAGVRATTIRVTVLRVDRPPSPNKLVMPVGNCG